MKIHLDIDEAQSVQDARWFPYAAEGNQVWYLMPETGSKVKLYFPSAEEDDAMVIQSVRHAPQGEFAEKSGRKMQDPGVKSFGNPQGKEITLGNHDLTMTAKEGLLYITMQSGIGVFMDSATCIRMNSSADLELHGRSVMLYGEKSLHLQTMSDTLELGEGGFKASSGQIKMNLTSSQAYTPIKSAFEQQRDELGLSGLIEKRTKRNKAVRAQGKQDALIEGVKGLWSFVVDAAEITSPAVLLGEHVYEEITGNKLAPLAERNSIAKAAVSGTQYVAEHVKNGQWAEMGSDAVEHVKKQLYEDYVEPLETKYKGDFQHNPLVTGEEENRKLGEADFKGTMIEVDVALNFVGIGEVKAAIKTLKSAVKDGKKISMKDLKKGASENKAKEAEHGEGAGKRPHGSAEGDSAPSGPPKDGKYKAGGFDASNPSDAIGALLQKMMKEMKDNSPFVIARVEQPVPVGIGMQGGPRYTFTIMKREDYNALYSSASDHTGGGGRGGSGRHDRDKPKRRDEEKERKRHDEEERERKEREERERREEEERKRKEEERKHREEERKRLEDKEGSEGTGNLNYKEGYYVEHLTGEVTKCTDWKGVSGGHNYDEFKKYFDGNGKYVLEEVNKLPHPDINGIYDLEYRMKVEIKDYRGIGTGQYKYIPKENKDPFKKTIYDPNIISSDDIVKFGKEAMEDGINQNQVRQLEAQGKELIQGTATNGLKYEGIRNVDTGEIENFWHALEWSE
ncbi:CdiA family toxin C-terminal domain-containing protein [Paenibacillus elgii]|uniref:CdiA family toxin C-terminal domain-containing protein n=1 Tax=Paenibacillus elgii TaxID=189691 RepID=UPI001F2BDB19|nr:CdiA family toxin C-terminal domain-containing protein [Paenibacillus elgii]